MLAKLHTISLLGIEAITATEKAEAERALTQAEQVNTSFTAWKQGLDGLREGLSDPSIRQRLRVH
jgi:hypothetical protein